MKNITAGVFFYFEFGRLEQTHHSVLIVPGGQGQLSWPVKAGNAFDGLRY
jgi:hypothetical protein